VVRERAALGIAFDGDGDRVNFIDETGVFVEPDVIGVLLMRHALAGGSRREAAAAITERPWAARTR
jgi:phosphomannomutase